MEEKTIEQALQELRETKKRKFIQTVDLIVNLKDFDVRKESLNTFIQIPNPSEKKICAFLTKKSKIVDTTTKEEFGKYKDNKDIKRLAKKYDLFIAPAPLMVEIATKFGRILGPLGKMPSPQAGIMPSDDEKSVEKMLEKMKKSLRIRTKEKSIKLCVGKEDLTNEQIKENIISILHSIENLLPRKRQNIKNVLIKLTMSKPIKIKYQDETKK